MTRTVFIHLGLPKTGTTSLQHYFLDELSGPDSPIAYVPVGLATNSREGFAHHNLPRAMTVTQRTTERYDPDCGSPEDIAAWILADGSGRPLLISAEGLWALAGHKESQQAFAAFINRLRPACRVVLLVTWRNYVDYKLSTFFHAAKFRPPAKPLEPPNVERMHKDFLRRVKVMAGLADELVVFRYSRAIMQHYIEFLADAVGAPMPPDRQQQMHNPSLNDQQRAFAIAAAQREKPMLKRPYKLKLRALTDDAPVSVELGFDLAALQARGRELAGELASAGNVRVMG